MSVDCESDLRHATVYYDTLGGEDDDEEVLEALGRAPPRAPGRHRPPGPREAHARSWSSSPTRSAATPRAPRRGPPRDPQDDDVAKRRRPDGLAIVDKAAGWTSHDVVAKARGVLGTRKVGHSGTLDPDATGVLLLGVGKVTRLLRYLGLPAQDLHGRDRARHRHLDPRRVRRGDAARWDMSGVDRSTTCERPPPPSPATSSRCRRWCRPSRSTGKRLHELAREGIEVEREARPVTVHRFDVRRPGRARAASRSRSTCSSGTYIRIAGRRRRHRPRRRRPPARPPPHRDRLVHGRPGRAARGARPRARC